MLQLGKVERYGLEVDSEIVQSASAIELQGIPKLLSDRSRRIDDRSSAVADWHHEVDRHTILMAAVRLERTPARKASLAVDEAVLGMSQRKPLVRVDDDFVHGAVNERPASEPSEVAVGSEVRAPAR